MLTLENRQYGGGYELCPGCNISFRVGDLLNNNRCAKCQPKFSCSVCLHDTDLERLGDAYHCRDRAACSERVWRVSAKRDELVAERIRMEPDAHVSRIYLHHNADCDYMNGQWSCPEPCGVSDPPWVEPGQELELVWPD